MLNRNSKMPDPASTAGSIWQYWDKDPDQEEQDQGTFTLISTEDYYDLLMEQQEQM